MSKGIGGGAKTNENGLIFEEKTDFQGKFMKYGIDALFVEKYKFSKWVESVYGIDTKSIWSKGLLPDEAIVINNTIFIIEKKYQNTNGSVDEKLQTCGFKKRQYKKITDMVGMEVVYTYLLSEWFCKPMYKDVFEYIEESGCYYFFVDIPKEFFVR